MPTALAKLILLCQQRRGMDLADDRPP